MTDLTYFTMAGTKLTGTLPSEIVRMKKLKQVTLAQTGISGRSGPRWTSLSSLANIQLANSTACHSACQLASLPASHLASFSPCSS